MDYNCIWKKRNPGLIDGYTPEQRFFMSWATIWGLKQEMQQSRTSKNRSTLQECTVRMCRYMWTRSIKLLILKGDGMYIAPENRVKTGSRLNNIIRKSQEAWFFMIKKY
jgi:predicted metalloendopeptidase